MFYEKQIIQDSDHSALKWLYLLSRFGNACGRIGNACGKKILTIWETANHKRFGIWPLFAPKIFNSTILLFLWFAVLELRRQVEATENRGEEERQNLAQELSRGKQAVISLMQVRVRPHLCRTSTSTLTP